MNAEGWAEMCVALEAERDQLIAWQTEAVEVLARWDRVAEMVPGAFKVAGARRSDCALAYIDHLRAENLALTRAQAVE